MLPNNAIVPMLLKTTAGISAQRPDLETTSVGKGGKQWEPNTLLDTASRRNSTLECVQPISAPRPRSVPCASRAHAHLKMPLRMPVLHSFAIAGAPNSSHAGLIIKRRNHTLRTSKDNSQKCNVSRERSQTLTIALCMVLFTRTGKSSHKRQSRTIL